MASKYSLEERCEIIILYGENQRHLSNTARDFNIKYPDRSKICTSTVSRIVQRFIETGNVSDRKSTGRPRTSTNELNTERCLSLVAINPKSSTRKIAQEINVGHASVCRILKRHKMHGYKMQIHQGLHAEDKDRRMEFCNWVKQQVQDINRHIIFSDEAIFHLSGHVNKHNSRYWSDTNPFWVEETSQVDPRVMVWCAMHDDTIIGPYFFEGSVTGHTYVHMLQEVLNPYLENMPLSNYNDVYFQQDGAPAHFATAVRSWLDVNLPNRWIGRRGPVEWPPRSPDLTPLDFYLWGYLKSKVYASRPRNIEELKLNIVSEISQISRNTLLRVGENWNKRIDHCLQVNGDHFEQFY